MNGIIFIVIVIIVIVVIIVVIIVIIVVIVINYFRTVFFIRVLGCWYFIRYTRVHM